MQDVYWYGANIFRLYRNFELYQLEVHKAGFEKDIFPDKPWKLQVWQEVNFKFRRKKTSSLAGGKLQVWQEENFKFGRR